MLSHHQNVEAVLCGHVHQDFDVMYQGVRVVATPSTCVQFKPNSDDFALDNESPGWRMLTLTREGELKLEVGRLSDGEFLPIFLPEATNLVKISPHCCCIYMGLTVPLSRTKRM